MYITSGVNQLTNTTYRPEVIIVTWDPASSPYCGEVLYYRVAISSDEHTNIPNNIVNTTCLTTTFLDLKSNTTYVITVNAFNRAGSGIGVSVTVSTSADLERQIPGIIICFAVKMCVSVIHCTTVHFKSNTLHSSHIPAIRERCINEALPLEKEILKP